MSFMGVLDEQVNWPAALWARGPRRAIISRDKGGARAWDARAIHG
jgi:hypothetical protein